MTSYESVLNQVTVNAPDWIKRLAQWVAIDSATGHAQGLERVITLLEERFVALGGKCRRMKPDHAGTIGTGWGELNHPGGTTLMVVKRPEAPRRVLLCGHVDTVLAPVAHAIPAGRMESGRLWGPGALDGKGGIAVMLAALDALEAWPDARRIGWEALVVSDEEIGSPVSRRILEDAAKACTLGLVFEPALANGALVGARPGSGNYVITIRGRSAHAGREPEKGRNAILALARFIVDLNESIRSDQGIRVNIGSVNGGGAVNVVPDFAQGRFNIRVDTPEALIEAEKILDDMVRRTTAADGISVELRGGFGRFPKLLDAPTLHLLRSLADCGRELGLDIRWQPTGGVCDGNTLAAAGLPNVDSLGPVGAGMHTEREYVLADSITKRARLAALFLMRFASGRIPWPPPGLAPDRLSHV